MPSEDPFEGTEAYYAEHRPGYGEEAIRYLRERFGLDGDSRVLDLGCGPGTIAIPLAAHVGEVVGMDPSEAMLDQARERASAAGRQHIEWVLGSDADLDAGLGTFRLTTIGRAFHRLDQQRSLDRLQELTGPDGGVALLGDPEWVIRGRRAWQTAVYEVVSRYVADVPERTGPIEYDEPYDETLAAAGYADVEVATFEFEREWSIDDIVGYVRSLSYCSPRQLGADRPAFEAEVRDRLNDHGVPPFVQRGAVRVVSGYATDG
ncbi:MAG: class I SAM-dependent methyltransferase [Halobacteriales archaeon]